MGVELRGMGYDLGDTSRYADYLVKMANNLQDKMAHHALPSTQARAIVEAIEELAKLTEPMRQYIEEKAREEEELARAREGGDGQ
jgi:mRNA-degrading endonuclease RelE of RelBE toxin-antitoxin system